jgi:release factor glutamine methyltransferase
LYSFFFFFVLFVSFVVKKLLEHSRMAETLIIKDILAKSAQWLAAKGNDTARLDAEVLLAHVLKMRRLDLYMKWDRPLDETEKNAYRDLLKRRAEHEPVAYLTGTREFFSLDFCVTPDVLIPRPETELLVEKALALSGYEEGPKAKRQLEWTPGESAADSQKHASPEEALPAAPSNPGLRIADVGVGSGAIAVALASKLPEAHIVATDVSPTALDMAKKNAEANQVRVDFRQTSLLDGIAELFDLVVSNPPYIPETDRATLPSDVVRYEPAGALFGGQDGLDVIRQLIPAAADRLKPGGWLLMEIGNGQGKAVLELLESDGRFEEAAIALDYNERERIASARKK